MRHCTTRGAVAQHCIRTLALCWVYMWKYPLWMLYPLHQQERLLVVHRSFGSLHSLALGLSSSSDFCVG